MPDAVLFLLLFFAEGWTRDNFPSPDQISSIEGLSIPGAWLVMLSSIPALACFFTRSSAEDVSEYGTLTKATIFFRLIGAFVASFASCSMFAEGALRLANYYLTGENVWILMGCCMLFFAAAGALLIGSWLFPVLYVKLNEKLRPMHPALRYLLMIPVIFFAASFMNSAADTASFIERSSLFDAGGRMLSYLFSFMCVFAGPRLFATGGIMQKKDALMWVVRFAAYLVCSYYNI